jgi:hypothetical protein
MSRVDSQVALSFLKHQVRLQRIKTLAAIFGGAILCLIGPLLIELFYSLISTTLISSYGFFGTYRIIAAITLPIFFLIAYLLKGSVLENAIPDGETLSGRIMRRWIAPALIIVEIANIGPRLVLWGLSQVMGERRVHGASLPRLAKCLVTLAAIDGGISPAKLTLPEENVDHLAAMLGFMLFYDLIDLSKQGDRVWLTSETRQGLGLSR